MLFHTKNKPIPHDFDSIDVEDIKIQRVNSTKYLGLIFDEKLSWTDHINQLCKGLLKYFGIFKNIRHYSNKKLCRTIYFAFVNSRISYGLQIYGTSTNLHLNKVQVLQNKLLKFLFKFDPMLPTNDLHRKIKILKIKDNYKVNVSNSTFKVDRQVCLHLRHMV